MLTKYSEWQIESQQEVDYLVMNCMQIERTIPVVFPPPNSIDFHMALSKIVRTDSAHPDFRSLVLLLDQELSIRDGDEHSFYAQYNKIDSISQVVVAYVDGLAVGCGAIRQYEGQTVEIKRMFVLLSYRSRGIAGEILLELEAWATESGFDTAILETGLKQPEAIRLYEKSGYTRIPNYGQYAGIDNSICMQKQLLPSA